MQKSVQRHLHGLPALGALKGMAEHIQKGAPLPSEASQSSSYVVELLDLSIRH